MKKVFILCMAMLLLQTAECYGQTLNDEQLEIQKIIIDDTDPGFQLTEVPEKWKNESAVVLCQKFKYFAQVGTRHVRWSVTCRKRIKILDKAAVDNFSQMAFLRWANYVEKSFYFIRVIKTDGNVIEVDNSKGVEATQTDINADGIQVESPIIANRNDNYIKIAIPALEVGDIIDFYSFYDYKSLVEATISAPFFSTWLHDEYPIIQQKFEYSIRKRALYNLKSINGCPEIVYEGIGSEIDGEENLSMKKFSITDTNREKISEERFLDYNRIYPKIGVHITSCGKRQKHLYTDDIFCSKPPVENYSVQSSDIKKFYLKYDSPQVTNGYGEHSDLEEILKKRGENCSSTEKAIIVFYYLRKRGYGNSLVSVFSISKHLNKLNIDHQILAIIPRSLVALDNIINPDELIHAIRVQDPDGKEIFLFDYIGEYSSQIDGAEAYVYFPKGTLSKHPENKKKSPERITLPKSVASNNVNNNIIKTSFDFENEVMNVESESRVTGFQKRRVIDGVLYAYDFKPEEDKLFGEETTTATTKKEIEKANEKAKEKEEMLKLRDEYLLNMLKKEYEVGTLKSTEVLNSGCFEDKELRFKQEFTIKSAYSKAGKNIIFDMGKLIGAQITLEEKEMERKYDIYYPYPCIFAYDILVSIPDGYSVEKLEDFNVSINNECMALTSTAAIEGHSIHFTFKKEYKNNFDTKEQWSKYVEVLEATHTLTQKKVILKML